VTGSRTAREGSESIAWRKGRVMSHKDEGTEMVRCALSLKYKSVRNCGRIENAVEANVEEW
jgi:hypothetical protein